MHVMPSYTTIMEDDLFGADGHAIARCSSVSLDFEGVLEAAEGVLHDQICEVLQRFDGEQAGVHENLQHTVHDGFFSIPAPYQPFHFLPDETTLQPDTNTSSVELERRRLPENSLHQILNDSSQVRNPIQSKQFTVEGRPLTASMGASAPPPRQLWSMDQLQTDQWNRASFQLQHDVLASQRSLVYGEAPESQACIPGTIPREFSTRASSSCSPINICANSISSQPHLPRKAEDVLSGKERRTGKSKRVPDQAGHIMRERLRRDDMTSKFLMLESLLPPGPKRDRATIVEHSIQHVKNLHHRKKGLQQKRTEMAKATRTLSLRPRFAQKTMATMHPLEIDKKISKTNDIAKTGNFFEKVEVHLNLPQKIVVEMMCRPHAHFQSQVFGTLERLKMDVLRCSVSRARGLVLCSIVLQPREILDPSVTSNDIAGALKRAIYSV